MGQSNHGSTIAVGLGEDRFDAAALRAIGHWLRRKMLQKTIMRA